MSKGAGRTKDRVLLTTGYIERLAPEAAPYRVADRRTQGLAIRVAASGLKTWDLAYRISGSGSVRRPSLGRFPDVTLADARKRANELTSAAHFGRDLIAEEKALKAEKENRITVQDLADKYVTRRVRGRLKTASDIERRLKRALHPLWSMAAGDVRRRDLRGLFDSVHDDGYPREAEKRRQTVGAMFRWGVSQDYVETDPTSGLASYDPGTPRSRVLSWSELERLWSWLQGTELPAAPPRILLLQMLLGARCSEIGGMTAEEFDRETWIWTLPAARSKNGKARSTPILGQARVLLALMLESVTAGPLFTTENGRSLTSSNVGQFLLNHESKLPVTKFTTHDLRRTFATKLVELDVSGETVAAIIGHSGASSAATRTLLKHYVWTDRIEQKRVALLEWDRALMAHVECGGGSAPTLPNGLEVGDGPETFV